MMEHVYTEQEFRKILVRERKRSERTQSAMLLVLVDVTQMKKSNLGKNWQAPFWRAVNEASRDIDVKGWHQDKKVVGVIYHDVTETSVEIVRKKLSMKLLDNLKADYKYIRLEFLAFPNILSNEPNAGAISKIYPNASYEGETKRVSMTGKRMLDIVGSLGCILLASPFFLLIPLIIKLTSRGPVFFCQERIGKSGRPFKIFKFRSMYTGNKADVHKEYVLSLIKEGDNGQSGGIKKLTKDPRITPVGQFLRKTSLDEIPQFFNVLLGDMSLVGPRPPLAYEAESYHMWHKRRLYEVKPGITGIWQTTGRSLVSFNDMVRMDIRYIESWSVIKDIYIILKTPFSLIGAKGAL